MVMNESLAKLQLSQRVGYIETDDCVLLE